MLYLHKMVQPALTSRPKLIRIEGLLDSYEYDSESETLLGATRPFQGKSIRTQQDVVIKYAPRVADIRLLHKECASYQRIEKEGGHRNIIAPLEIIMGSESPEYLILPFMPGKDMFDILQAPLSLPESAVIIEKLSEAVHFTHRAGIVHRDLSLYTKSA